MTQNKNLVYIEHLKVKGFETRIIVSFLIGETEKRQLNIDERKFIGEYIRDIEQQAKNGLKAI